MTTRLPRFWQTPQRLSRRQATLVGVLAIVVLAFAATGIFLFEGWSRLVHVSALALMGLTNLALALGSLLPEERGGMALRDAVVPLSLLMFVALLASILLFRQAATHDGVLSGVIVGLVTALTMHLEQRRKLCREQVQTGS